MDFIQARLESIRKKNYDFKQKKLNYALEFMREYIKSDKNIYSLNLKKNAYEYFLASKGIVCYDKPNLMNITSEKIENIYNEICENSEQTFKKFYDSYKRKIDQKYNEDFIDNAFQDLLNAYKLYCISNNITPQNDPKLSQLEALNEKISKSIIQDKTDMVR